VFGFWVTRKYIELELLFAYFLIGLGFGIFFIFFGASRLDEDVKNSPLKFRLLILPGSMVLWPYLAYKLIIKR
jgi:hypothetical protein